VQGIHAFTLEDDADHKISGYTTFDLLGSRDTEFGTFSGGIQNLLDKQYSTVWGHRLKRQNPRTLFKNRGFFLPVTTTLMSASRSFSKTACVMQCARFFGLPKHKGESLNNHLGR
jgi:hypothetical protein